MSVVYRYQIEVSHEGLHKYRIIKAATSEELKKKEQAILNEWAEQWSKKCEREKKIKNENDSIEYAKELTQQAEETQSAIDRILLDDLDVHRFNLDDFKDKTSYPEPRPSDPALVRLPQQPDRTSKKYNSELSGLARLSKKKVAENEANNQARYESDIKIWDLECKSINIKNEAVSRAYADSIVVWEREKGEFERRQSEENAAIDLRFDSFTKGERESVEWLIVAALERIEFPFDYDKYAEVEYNSENKSIIVDYSLPSIDDIPKLKSVSYVKSKNEFKESFHAETHIKKKYESVIYQTVLQILNYIFTLSSGYDTIDSVTVNGKVRTVDKATGKEIEPYILSLNVARETFYEVNISSVDPKTWFKSSKGVSAASLTNVTPIAPVLVMSKEDKRFIEGYGVVDQIDDSVNLAAIDWQDFENLIRELFAEEFSSNGGEVKITQASRDGGVDAIAFDPDPIRGGKIVIQAKRYTNVVGVSAVRDLYGTVVNEGATKGILVTTSNFGNDAYSFAQGKPLTLLNGAHLLYLLDKHGHKAKIDLKEAKELLSK